MPKKKIIISIAIFILAVCLLLAISGLFGGRNTPDDQSAQSTPMLLSAPQTHENNTLELEFSDVTKLADTDESIIVDNAVICLDVRDRTPVNEINKVESNAGRIFCWTMLLNGEGRKIRYIWYLGDNITASQWLSVNSNKFRAWCPRNIDNKMVGPAHVDIVDENGRILRTIEFEIVPAKSSKMHAKYS